MANIDPLIKAHAKIYAEGLARNKFNNLIKSEQLSKDYAVFFKPLEAKFYSAMQTAIKTHEGFKALDIIEEED